MNRTQRIILVIYCLSLAYCFVWIPWSVTTSDRFGTSRQRLGYGWVWAGPRYPDESAYVGHIKANADGTGTATLSDIEDPDEHSNWDVASSYARPDLPLIAFRLTAATAITAAVLFIAGLWKSATLS